MQCNVISLFNLARPEQAPAIVETSASSLFGLTMVEYDQNVEKTGTVSKWLQNLIRLHRMITSAYGQMVCLKP